MKKELINSERTILTIYFIISIIIGSIVVIYLNDNLLDYNFVEINKRQNGYKEKFFETFRYTDIDHDGKSEIIVTGYEEKKKNYFFQILSLNGKVWDQFNFGNHSIFDQDIDRTSRISFQDINNDNTDEIFVIATYQDSLFLTIISPSDLNYIVKNQKIYTRRNIRKNLFWDVDIAKGKLIDLNGDGNKDFLISFHTGYALDPRGFLVYDIHNKRNIDSLLLKSSFNDFKIFDIDKDGDDEIIGTTSSGGNVPITDTTDYHDYTSWFFCLDKNFDSKFTPHRFGGFRTSTGFTIRNIADENFILAWATQINDSLDARFTLFTDKGEVKNDTTINNFGLTEIKSFEVNDTTYLIANTQGYVKIFYTDLKEKRRAVHNSANEKFLYTGNFTGDTYPDILSYDGNRYIVRDFSLKVIAEIEIDEDHLLPQMVNYGKDNTDGTAIQTKLNNTVYKLAPSLLSRYFYLISAAIFLTIFSIFFLFHYLMKKISMLYQSFLFFVRENDSALLLLDQGGRVLNFNKQFESFSKCAETAKGLNINSILSDKINVRDSIQKSIEERRGITEKISFYENETAFNGRIEVYPYRSRLGYIFGYLVKIIDQTEDIQNERLHVWSHTAQKVAHEIKTPLSSIQLNLKTLKKRLEKLQLQNSSEIEDDINTIDNQLNRIKNQTSSLLKITNLEKSSVQQLRLDSLIKIALEKFVSYINEGVIIKIDESVNNIDILFDRNQFVEVMQIIIENSIDALKGEGKIEIAVTDKNKKTISLKITDFGTGIEKKNLAYLFDPYFTSKKEGTGLGLAFAKKIMTDNNGAIEVGSIYGKWTSVILKIPITSDK